MSLQIPPAINYKSPLVAVPLAYLDPPAEGVKMMPCEIDWGSMGGPNNNVYLNLQNNATLNFRNIRALSVDNSDCGSDVTFIFPDTQETTTIPAYAPKTIIEVFTNQTQFYVYAPNAAPEDVTRFSIHNSLPPPIAVPVTKEQNTAVFENIAATDGTTTLVTSPVAGVDQNGTVENIDVFFASGSGSGGSGMWQIVDGETSPKVIAGGTATNGFTGTCFRLNDGNVRFQKGLKFVVSSSALTGGIFSVNVAYRQP